MILIAGHELEEQFVEEKYQIRKWIGGGQFGDVFLADELLYGKPLRRVAIKILKMEQMNGEKLKGQFNDCTFPALLLDREVDQNLKKHFVQIYNWGFTRIKNKEKAYIVMEFVADSEDLRKIITRNQQTGYSPDPDYVEEMMLQLFTGLSLAHDNNVLHRDLKPENLLYSHKTLRIVDFGLGIEMSHKSGYLGEMAGTIMYMAPENFKELYTFSSDVYSAGLVIYELWTNYHPFSYLAGQIGPRSEDNRVINYEARQKWRYIKGNCVNHGVKSSDKLDNILKRCLSFELTNRYQSAGDVLRDIKGYKTDKEKKIQQGFEAYNSGDWEAAAIHLMEVIDEFQLDPPIRLKVLETIGYSLFNEGHTEKAIVYLLKAYNLDEEKLILVKEQHRRDKILQMLADCYQVIGQKGSARIYLNKIGTSPGQMR